MIDLTKISRESPSWRLCPFRIGVSYQVLHDFRSSYDLFGGEASMVMAGQAMTFEFESSSRYDGQTFYLFVILQAESVCGAYLMKTIWIDGGSSFRKKRTRDSRMTAAFGC